VTNPTKIGRYEIIERVGRGGMGVLYRGRDTVLDREVAIKVMVTDFDTDGDEDARPRFYREARAAAKLQHRNIVTIFEFGEEEHTPFIVMEFLRGQDLARRVRTEPPLGLGEKIDVVADLCTGLHFAHEQGVVHRDVKPANIWVQQDGSVKLLDFGIAKFASSTMTRQGAVFGSVAYMSPEQVGGSEVDGRADVFSAGVVLYELLAGKKPFEGSTPTAVLARIVDDRPAPIEALGADVPRPLAAAVAKALQKDREKRYRHAADFAADLRLVRSALAAAEPLTSAGGSANPDLGTAPLRHVPSPGAPAGAATLHKTTAPAGVTARRSAWLGPAVAAALVIVSVAAVLLHRGRPEPMPTAPGQPGNSAPAPVAAASPVQQPPAKTEKPAVLPGAEGQRVRSAPVVPAGQVPGKTAVPGRAAAPPSTGGLSPDGRESVETPARRPARPAEYGRLQLRAVEGCSVNIDERDFGEPPFPPAAMPFPAGSHTAKLTCGGTVVRSVIFHVPAGDLYRLQLLR
jgi:eukaryotic-like serine/threonine-protein kinase